MSDIAIRVENLGKLYRIGAAQKRRDTLRDVIGDWRLEIGDWIERIVHPTSNVQLPTANSIWALKDVSFQVQRGEVVGIIGRNGAGKSTLLKILSRITEPTAGRAEIHGRVGSLLEVGTGFHPELTGRENIYLNGAILGMRRAEIERKFDEIVAFAEIEKFLDTPVKHYSSGMYVRLAFAVAAHLEPEILLVDEVLAVGDAAFQKKCLGKMGDVAKEGRTVLFVSHNMGAIRSLCERGILLSSGQIFADKTADGAVDDYLSTLSVDLTNSGEIVWNLDRAPGSGGFHLRKIRLATVDGNAQCVFVPQLPIDVHIDYELTKPVPGMRVVLQVQTLTGEIAFTSTDQSQRQVTHYLPGHYVSICRIPPRLMNVGDYLIRIWAGIPGIRYLLEPSEFIRFSVIGAGSHGSTYVDSQKWPGVLCPDLEWRIVEEAKQKHAV